MLIFLIFATTQFHLFPTPANRCVYNMGGSCPTLPSSMVGILVLVPPFTTHYVQLTNRTLFLFVSTVLAIGNGLPTPAAVVLVGCPPKKQTLYQSKRAQQQFYTQTRRGRSRDPGNNRWQPLPVDGVVGAPFLGASKN